MRRSRSGTLLTALAVLAAVSAFLVSAQAGKTSGAARGGLLAGGAVLTGCGIVLAAIERTRGERARRSAEQVALDSQEELTLTLNGALAPITSYLGELATTRGATARQAVSGQLRQAVVDAAVTLTADGARSAYYGMDGRRTLVRAVYGGRSSLPRERFVGGTPDGDFVLDLVQRGDLVFVGDVRVDPLVTPSTSGYRTVIAVAVTAGSRRLGLLTVDAPEPGDLTGADVELVRVLANLLGSGLALA